MVYMLVLIVKPSLALTPEENEARQVDRLAQFSHLGWSRIHTCVGLVPEHSIPRVCLLPQ